jgi:ABC-2 type transport system permease protein
MSASLAIARRDLQTFFASPIAYVVFGVFLLVGGFVFFGPVFISGRASMRAYFTPWAPVLFVVFIPALTMRLLAEERKTGTLELLLTFPVRDGEVVLGKFLAALGMVAAGLAWTLPYPITLAALSAAPFDWGVVVAGYLGLLLLASSFLGLGLWASAASRNQIVGFILGLLICFAFWFVDKFSALFPPRLASVLQYLSVDYHMDNIARGVLDTRDLLFYLSLTAASLLFTTRTLSSVRQ